MLGCTRRSKVYTMYSFTFTCLRRLEQDWRQRGYAEPTNLELVSSKRRMGQSIAETKYFCGAEHGGAIVIAVSFNPETIVLQHTRRCHW